MRDAQRRMPGVLGAVMVCVASLLAGCSKPAAVASVLNQTGSDLKVAVWPTGLGDDAGEERVLGAGVSTTYRFEYEQTEPPLAVYAELVGAQPQVTTLEPPGPFIVEVRRAGAGVEISVRRDPGAPDTRVPEDARNRGFNEDIPPVSPPPPR